MTDTEIHLDFEKTSFKAGFYEICSEKEHNLISVLQGWHMYCGLSYNVNITSKVIDVLHSMH